MSKKTNTRTASGTGSIRQRPDGRWEGRLIVGYDPGTGKPIRRSVYGDTQKAVRQEMTNNSALSTTAPISPRPNSRSRLGWICGWRRFVPLS